MEKIIISMDDG
jgi:hypothetical protein